MPLTKLAVDALGVITICLVSLLALAGVFCIVYTLHFRYRIQRSGFTRLSYFNGPWIVRISLVLFGIWWGVGEIVRLSLLRQKDSAFYLLDQRWQEIMCKYYILANLGFTEPCLFLTICFLLRASLKWRRSGILSSSRRWNTRTVCYVMLFCLPIFVLNLFVVFIAPNYDGGNSELPKLPPSFTRTTRLLHSDGEPFAVCCYPLLSTILHGLFTAILIIYLLLLGGRMVSNVINKGLRRRVYTLILLVTCLLPSRVVLLAFLVLARTHFLILEALAFVAFLALLSCILVGIFMLVYLPAADSLVLGSSLQSVEAGVRFPYATAASAQDHYSCEPVPLISAAGQSLEMIAETSHGRISDASTKRGSISFRTMIRDDPLGEAAGASEEEMRTFSPDLNPSAGV